MSCVKLTAAECPAERVAAFHLNTTQYKKNIQKILGFFFSFNTADYTRKK
jgi:hypothetical protein